MTAKEYVIDYAGRQFAGHDDVKRNVLDILSLCDSEGALTTLSEAYKAFAPSVEFRDDPNAESGAFYDANDNKIVVRPEGDAKERADMFLFESFNCAHTKEYKALNLTFGKIAYPPMLFLAYGRKKSSIEGKATFEYLSLLREVRKNSGAYEFTKQGKQALKSNDDVMSKEMLIAKMTWTPHEPSGTGDFQFASPEHYAFRKVMDLKTAQATWIIRILIANAAVRDGHKTYGSGISRVSKAYNVLDPEQRFLNWWKPQWENLDQGKKPTAFISVTEKANEFFAKRTIDAWRPITLSDFELDVRMELEARRLSRLSPLVSAPTPYT